jgi:hypothetical protein
MTDQMAEAHRRDYELKRDIDRVVDGLLRVYPAFQGFEARSILEDAMALLDEERARLVRVWD